LTMKLERNKRKAPEKIWSFLAGGIWTSLYVLPRKYIIVILLKVERIQVAKTVTRNMVNHLINLIQNILEI